MKEYIPLHQRDPMDAVDENDLCNAVGRRKLSAWPSTVLITSVGCNIILFMVLLVFLSTHLRSPEVLTDARTLYAGLQWDKTILMGQETPYIGHDLNQSRKIWEDISIDAGMVALPDSFVAQHGLPTAQRYPWDHSKGLYFLNGYHNLHCLRAIHISLMEFANGERQSRRFHHVLHCMEALRQDIICHADDTPRYTTADEVPESGVGQPRRCRDWRKLEEFAEQHNACYRFINQTATGFPNVLRYTWCPEGSPDLAEVTRIMGGSHLSEFL